VNTSKLKSPPRSIPFFLGLQCLFGGFLQQIGWGVLAFSLIFVLVFGSSSNLSKEAAFHGEIGRTDGLVKDYQETSAEINEREVVEYIVEYTVDGSTLQDVCYTTGYKYDEGDKVKVEYCIQNPSWARIVGSRVGIFPSWTLLLVGLFPALGAFLAIQGFRDGLKSRSLLGQGKLGQGVLVSKEATDTSVNEATVYAMTFRFRPEGGQRDFTTVAKTHLTEHLEDDEQELLLYDPRFPSRAVLLDNLPGKARISPNGSLIGGSLFSSLAVLILPFVACALTVLCVLIFLPG
jgi:uncharacterized protein DUF3592